MKSVVSQAGDNFDSFRSVSPRELGDSFFRPKASPERRGASPLQKKDSRAFQRDSPDASGESLAWSGDSSGRIRES